MARRQPSRSRRGKVVVLLALCLAGIVGMVALAADGGMLLENRRGVQSAADMAAMAAAIDLYKNFRTNQGYDPQGSAADRAREAAAAQGYTHGTDGVTVQVYIPPQTGDHVGTPGYAEVVIDYPQPRYFAAIFGSSSTHVRGRAVARGRLTTGKTGILVLNLTASEALKANGSGTVSVVGADIIVNSSDPQSVGGDGQGAIIKDIGGAIDLSGGVKANTILQGTVNYNQIPTPDPLAYLPQPTLPALALTAKGLPPTSSNAKPYLDALGLQAKDVNGQVYILDPGRYDKMPNFTNGDVVILKQASTNSQQGVYYLNGSGFTSNGATVIMDPTGGTTGGIMFYNDPGTGNSNSGGISINGGRVNLAPPSGGTYQGLSIFQNRASTVALSIAGQGSTQITGTFYAAGAPISITGSSATAVDVIGSQYISDTLQSGGNGKYAVNWDPNLTAPIRQLQLVE